MKTIKERTKGKIMLIVVDGQELRLHLSKVVQQNVEEMLKDLLEIKADALFLARRYEGNARHAAREPQLYV